ncbi:hypothetical protein TTHT_0714 [Thermotomaculum hydrothermale]|uniref:Oxygen tolerance n=1 Tax=Thermotomaculum hydrothermale TaxID=981385 RepID=A0A7R6PX48_9BACT|nr:hypothetical protein [Thermotomaculum hydrothermale]BBB32285.1 hypothetical protein TTHT_0714 [Thermotomaculum hydrothermale]
MRKKALIIVFLFSLFAIAREPNITVSLTKYKCSIGDKITAEVKVVTDSKAKVEFDIEKNEDKDIVVENYKTETKKLPEDMKLTTLTFTVQSFKLGDISIGKVKVKVDGKEYEKEIPKITVQSILPENKKKINPLKPQASIKPDYSYLKRYVKYALIAILILIILYFLLKKLIEKIKGREKKVEEKPEILESPCIEIKKLTSSLLGRTYLKEGRVKEFFVELSEIAKRFLGRVFDFDYESKTSEEIFELINGKVKIEEESLIKDFFEICDLVKFAKYLPEQSEINRTVNTLYQFADLICKRLKLEEEKGEEKDVQV